MTVIETIRALVNSGWFYVGAGVFLVAWFGFMWYADHHVPDSWK